MRSTFHHIAKPLNLELNILRFLFPERTDFSCPKTHQKEWPTSSEPWSHALPVCAVRLVVSGVEDQLLVLPSQWEDRMATVWTETCGLRSGKRRRTKLDWTGSSSSLPREQFGPHKCLVHCFTLKTKKERKKKETLGVWSNEKAPSCCEVKGCCGSECTFISDGDIVEATACGEVLIHVSDTSFGHIHFIRDVPYTKIAQRTTNTILKA